MKLQGQLHGVLLLHVSIPKRVSEVLKQMMHSVFVTVGRVSIPKRVSEVLKPEPSARYLLIESVSIPKRVSEVLKPTSGARPHCSIGRSKSFNP